jgi:hypothetical protein
MTQTPATKDDAMPLTFLVGQAQPFADVCSMSALDHCFETSPPSLNSCELPIFRASKVTLRVFAMIRVQALVTVAGNQSAQTICGKAASHD